MRLALLALILSLCAIPAQATIRGSACQATTSTSTATVNWPTGTIAGDEAIIFGGSAFNTSLPSGWTDSPATGSAYFVTGSVWDGTAFWRTLNSGDISTGHVDISIAGTFDVTFCIVTFAGSPTIREVDCGSNVPPFSSDPACRTGPQFSSPQGVTTLSGVVPSDILLLFGSARTSGSGGTRTVAFGMGHVLQFADSGTNAYAQLGYDCLASGVTTDVFTYGAAGINLNQVILVVEGAGASAPCPVNSRHKATVY